MPASSLKILRDAIKRRVFDGAYYIVGDDEYQKDDAVRQLIDGALESTAKDFNLDVRRAGDLDAETLGVLLSTPPMMAERRIVVLRDVAGLKKDPRKVLDDYLKRPASDLLLILSASGGSKIESSLAAAATTLQFDPIAGERVELRRRRFNSTLSPAIGFQNGSLIMRRPLWASPSANRLSSSCRQPWAPIFISSLASWISWQVL